MLVKQVCQEILLLVCQAIQEREEVRLIPQDELGCDYRCCCGLPDDKGGFIIQGLGVHTFKICARRQIKIAHRNKCTT